MMTLLKQARAFGVGMMLTTQNPVDLDYKGLTNAGTWFIGKLQTERDKARLMDGLESAMAQAGTLTDTRVLDKLISSLDNRIFLLHDVHQGAPLVFTTRWAMSYLRGPLTRQQVKTLMAERKAAALAQPAAAGAAAAAPIVTPKAPAGLVAQPPVLPPGIKQVCLPLTVTESQALRALADRVGGNVTPSEKRLVYEPALLGLASIRFADRKLGLDESQDYSLLLPSAEGAGLVSWKDAVTLDLEPRDLEDSPAEGAFFVADLPLAVSSAKALAKVEDDFADHLYRNQTFSLAYNPTLKLYARSGEAERDFKVRCQQAAREARDNAVDKLNQKYDVQLQRLQDRLENAQQELEQSKAQQKGRAAEEVLSDLATAAGVLGGLFGGRRRVPSLRGLSTAATKRRMTSQASADIAQTEADISRLKAQVDDLKSQIEEDANTLTKQWDAAANDTQETRIVPRKTDVDVQMVVLAWAPTWEVAYQDARGRSRTDAIPAYPVAKQE
jgi:hypothetical protein